MRATSTAVRHLFLGLALLAVAVTALPVGQAAAGPGPALTATYGAPSADLTLFVHGEGFTPGGEVSVIVVVYSSFDPVVVEEHVVAASPTRYHEICWNGSCHPVEVHPGGSINLASGPHSCPYAFYVKARDLTTDVATALQVDLPPGHLCPP